MSVAASGAHIAYLVLPSYVRDALQDPTVVRIRGQLLISAASGNIFGAWGIIPWADINDTVPAITDAPLPYTRPSMDWMYWSFYANPLSGAAFSAQWSAGGSGTDVDSKAMRRLGNDKGVLLVIENPSGIILTAHYGFRILVKE